MSVIISPFSACGLRGGWDLRDDLASISSGSAVEDGLSITLPFTEKKKKKPKEAKKHSGSLPVLIFAGYILRDLGKILLCVLGDASCMIRATFGGPA